MAFKCILLKSIISESHVDKIDVSERWHRVLGTVEKIAELNIWHRNEVIRLLGVVNSLRKFVKLISNLSVYL